MHPVERVVLWSAVVILFILYLLPGQSGYIGRKITFMEMREFDKVPADLQKIYQDNALRFADALGETMEKVWNELTPENKKKVTDKYTENVTKVIETMKSAKKQNGNDMAIAFLAPPGTPTPMKNPPPTYAPPGTRAETVAFIKPSVGVPKKEEGIVKQVSKYMSQPSMFFPMTSGFSLDETLSSIQSSIESVPKSSGYSAY